MKDSQKKKVPPKKQKTKSQKIVTQTLSKSSIFLSLLKKQFVILIVVVTAINLILGIIIVYLIGKVEQAALRTQYSELQVPDLPIFSSSTDISVSADSLMVFEKDSRTVVFQKRGSLRFTPASTTKIMTALVALEQYNTDQYLTAFGVSSVKGSKMGLVEGEEIKVIDLLYGLMLPSGNDAAYVFAANYPGGHNAFVKRMNEKAQEMKLYNTVFYDPAGLEDKNYTTAFDLARLAVVALQNETLKKVVDTRYITVYDRTFTYEHRLENLNRLLNTPGVFGVKTGYTDEAGQVLVTSMESNGKTYIIVVLKSDDRFSDTEKILEEVIRKIQLETF
ncbi:MAG TPA: D-alanyl-D-alanine carboxypeptidase [Candidatus Levybacteria bacterium]|nr:D-alanyl-D-alanine carboxypeptidase [Candidatus Levybacteria bacterium]